MPDQFWVQIRGEITGPFQQDELMQMAAARKLRPDDKVSADQKHWVIAARVPGLLAVPRPLGEVSAEDEAKSFRAVPIEDSSNDEADYHLSPTPEPAIPEKQKQPHMRRLPVGTQRYLEIPQQTLGAALGGLFGGIVFLVSWPLWLMVDVLANNQFGAELAVIPLCALVVGIGVFIVAMLGTFNTFEMDVHQADTAYVSLTRRFAYIPWSQTACYVTSGDHLVKSATPVASFFDDTTAVDAVMLILVLTCCAMGGIPGILFWVIWMRSRSGDGAQVYRFRLQLRARAHVGPMLLHQERTEDYYATRFGTPESADKMIQLLLAAVPDLEVMEVEE